MLNGNSNLLYQRFKSFLGGEPDVYTIPNYKDALVEFSCSVTKSMFTIMCVDRALIEVWFVSCQSPL